MDLFRARLTLGPHLVDLLRPRLSLGPRLVGLFRVRLPLGLRLVEIFHLRLLTPLFLCSLHLVHTREVGKCIVGLGFNVVVRPILLRFVHARTVDRRIVVLGNESYNGNFDIIRLEHM